MKKVLLNNTELDFQLDTGAAISILSERQWVQLGSPKLSQTSAQPTNFDGTKIKTLGQLYTNIKIDEELSNAVFIVVKSDKQYGLIGRNIINTRESKISVHSVQVEELPEISGFKASISLIDKESPLKLSLIHI